MALTLEQQKALARARAKAKLQTRPSSPPEEGWGDMVQANVEDLVNVAPGALTRGVSAVAGLPGTIDELVTSGMDYLFQPTPEQKQKMAEFEGTRLVPKPPSAQGLIEAASEATRPGKSQPSPLEYKAKRQLGKYGGTALEIAPSVVVGPGGLLSKILTGAGAAAGSETAAQAFPEHEMIARTVGALGGGVLPNIARRAVTPLPISPRRQVYVDALRREGVPLTGGQASGRRMLQYLEDELSPSGAGNIMEQQKEQFTAAAMRRTGTAATGAGPDDLNPAFQRISNEFTRLTRNHALVPDRQFTNEVAQVMAEYGNTVQPSEYAPILTRTLDDLALAQSQGAMRGTAYQEMRSRLGKVARGMSATPQGTGNNVQLAHALEGIQTALDNAMERTIAVVRPDDLGAFRQARTQWGAAKTVEKAMSAPGDQTAQGLLTPSRLRTATSKEYARGRSDLTRLARAGEAVMKPLPQSGTASRATVRGLFSSLGGILAGTHSGGDLPTTLAGMAAGTVVPSAAGRVLLSSPVRRWLANQGGRHIPTNARLAAMIAALSQKQPSGPR